MESQLHSFLIWFLPVIIILSLWDAVWKLIAMWRAAQKSQLAWFICLFIFNTIGILPIIYILINKENKDAEAVDKA